MGTYVFLVLNFILVGRPLNSLKIMIGYCYCYAGVREVRVNSVEEAMHVANVGRKALHFSETKLNQKSSRSHSIFTIKVYGLVRPDNPQRARPSMSVTAEYARTGGQA